MLRPYIQIRLGDRYTTRGVVSAIGDHNPEIFFNDWSSSTRSRIDVIAFDQREVLSDSLSALDNLPRPISEPIDNNLTSSRFYSSATLVGVETIVPSRDLSLKHRPYTGMLILYQNGHRECLGSFRTDLPLKPINVEWRVRGIFFYINTIRGRDYVQEIQVEEPAKYSDLNQIGWKMVELGSTVDWWFGSSGVRILQS